MIKKGYSDVNQLTAAEKTYVYKQKYVKMDIKKLIEQFNINCFISFLIFS